MTLRERFTAVLLAGLLVFALAMPVVISWQTNAYGYGAGGDDDGDEGADMGEDDGGSDDGDGGFE